MKEEFKSLTEELSNARAQNAKKRTKDTAELYDREYQMALENDLAKNALKVGDRIPEFTLGNALGKLVSSKELLAKGPIVISFYRGGWCPYCNLELRAYQAKLGEIKEAGGQLVAISPALADDSMSVIEKHNLEFEVLSDVDSIVCKKFGIVVPLSKELAATYEKNGLSVAKTNGNKNYDLPLGATYVVNKDGVVVECYVSYDYTTRMDPKVAIGALKKLK